MVLPFFGKKPSNADGDDPEGDGVGGKRGPRTESSALVFTHLGDGRGLLAAAEKIQVSESSSAHSAIEEAAILYASANESGARLVLEEALADPQGTKLEEVWWMLLDLYRLTNARDAFEIQAVEYARRFERSPPVWDNESAQRKAVAPVDAGPSMNLVGNISAQSTTQFDQMMRIAQKSGKLRVDAGRVKGIDAAGAEALHQCLLNLKQAGISFKLVNPRTLFKLLEGQLKQGERERQGSWLLAFMLLQYMNEPERFDELALDYAITFEESPPSYDSGAANVQTEASGTEDAEDDEPLTDYFPLEGEIRGAQHEAIGRLSMYTATRSVVDIDASRLKRIDFVGAGSLFNLLAQCQAQGKQTSIHHANAMVAALLGVMGVHQVARVEIDRK